jgi:hypothetical protein
MGTDTQLYKELKKQFVGLNPTRAARLLSIVADKLTAEMRVVEEMLCCLSKDITKRDAEMEPYIVGQSYRYSTRDDYFKISPSSEQPSPYIIQPQSEPYPQDV